METTYRTTLNGTKWMLKGDRLGCALMMQNWNNDGFHFSGDFFATEAEAHAFLDGIDQSCAEPRKNEAIEIPADYYGVANRYYGD